MGKILAVVNQKGGVGKTTTTVNLTSALGELGKKCLLVDIDPQGNATSGLGADKRKIAVTAYYLLIDCPPSLGLLTLNALCASDTFLVPIQCEYYALEGLSQLMTTVRQVKRLYNAPLELEGVLLTMYDGRLNLTQQVVAEVKKFFPRKVFATAIPRSVRLSEAPSFGKPINYYDRGSKGAEAYDALARELTGTPSARR